MKIWENLRISQTPVISCQFLSLFNPIENEKNLNI